MFSIPYPVVVEVVPIAEVAPPTPKPEVVPPAVVAADVPGNLKDSPAPAVVVVVAVGATVAPDEG